MNAQIIGRLLALVCFCIFLTVILHKDHAKKADMGRDAFIASETARFDRDYSRSRPIAVEFIGCTIVMVLWFGSYELIAFGVSKAVGKMNRDESVPGRNYQ